MEYTYLEYYYINNPHKIKCFKVLANINYFWAKLTFTLQSLDLKTPTRPSPWWIKMSENYTRIITTWPIQLRVRKRQCPINSM